MTLLKLITNPLNIFRGPTKKGPKTLPIILDFTATQLYTIDFATLEFQEFLEAAQTIFVDNSLNAAVLIVTCSSTGQVITFPAKSCGYVPLLQPVPGTIDIFTTGGIIINIQLLNYHIDPNVWSVSPPSASTGGGRQPGGRITLRSNEPVLQTDVPNGNTVFYTPYLDNTIQLYNGVAWVPRTFVEVSQTLADATKSPAATIASACYDMLAWDDAGTFRCTRGTKWTNANSRGAGAGTAEIIRQDGAWVNRFAVTNGPAALRGLVVGTIGTTPFNDCRFMVQTGAAAGGNGAWLGVWNMYNRVIITAINIDTTVSWVYSLVAWQVKNNSPGNEIWFVDGLIEDTFTAWNMELASNSTGGGSAFVSVGLDNTTPIGGVALATSVAARIAGGTAVASLRATAIGANFVAPLESAQNLGVTTWVSGTGPLAAFIFQFRM